MRDGTLTSRTITEWYLERIAAVDNAGTTLNAVIAVNPDALGIADAATVLDVLAGTDPQDPATAAIPAGRTHGLADALESASLKGRRLGIVRRIGATTTAAGRCSRQAEPGRSALSGHWHVAECKKPGTWPRSLC